jgi:glyoxylase-like metal-dependent hydrolase (beta-lactamase superfamily II)
MIHETLAVGMLGCNCSVFGDEVSREAVVIDPGDDIPLIEALLQKHGLRVTAIVITHAHIDHIGGAAQLKSATGAPVYMNAADQPLYDHLDMQAAWLGVGPPSRTSIDVDVRDGSTVMFPGAPFNVLHTPGHTPGSICLWMPSQDLLIAGDTLFRESIGRTDLPGGDGRQILRSIRDKLWHLPESATVLPGHGPNTTVAHEREFNPFLSAL